MKISLNLFRKDILIFMLLALFGVFARADYVGELQTTKYFDQATVALIKSRLPGGLLAGDVVSYIIQFTPTDNGGSIGAGSFITDYIPSGTQVVGAQFVHLNTDGTYYQIAPPKPAAVFPALLPMYTDTGIFYSTDARTAVYTSPASNTITQTNGYALATPSTSGCNGISLPSTTHNAWDSTMYNKFYNASGPGSSGTCSAPPATNYTTAGLSPVAGPNTYLTTDSTGAVGPWQRISYPGSLLGTATGIAVAGTNNGTSVSNACVGGAATSAGWNLSAANPLPINTNAIRFAAGKVAVGELFSVVVSLKLTANIPVSGIINNAEVFGGDVGLDMGNGGSHPSSWNQWHYDCPAVATSNSQLMVVKNLVGACTGSGCTPAPITAGVVPSAANLKLRYQIQYVNLGAAAQTSVVLTDTLATGAAYLSGTYVTVSGTGTGAPTGTTVLTFPTIATLGSGASGVIQYDVNVATAPADGVALINTAKLVSTQVPSPGVTSKAIATVSTQANLWISKSTTTSSVTSGNNVSYTITIPNSGSGNASNLVVNDYLPSSNGVTGTTVNDRFSYVSGSALVKLTTAAGVVTTITPTSISSSVAAAAPYTGLNREQLVITLPAATAIPLGGNITVTFSAVVGSNVPASATPYLNDANVWYAGGTGGAGANTSYSETIGTAPVTVTAPMSLVATVDCVYAGASCMPYSNGTIAPSSKIRYRLSYSNISATTLSNVVLTDTLPANTSFVTGSAIGNGNAITPTVAGQLLTFPTIASLGAAPTSGYVTFDVQLGAAITSGTDITNAAKITAASFPSGLAANVTTSVRSQANLQIAKSVSPSSIQSGGTVTYTVTVTNTGDADASGINIYDELPYSGSVANAAMRFNYAAAGTFTSTDAITPSGLKVVATTPTLSVPPTFVGYTVQTNRQEVYTNFAPAGAQVNDRLAPGTSFSFTYTATVGASVPANATPYTSDVQAKYISATNTMYASAAGVAPVTIGGVDHYEMSLPSSGISCLPTTVTVVACADTSSPCANKSPSVSGQTASLATSGATLGATTVIFNAAGAASTTLSYPAAADGTTVSVTLSGEQTPASKPRMCCPNGASCVASDSCSSTFNTAGFIVSAAANAAATTIPKQVAGTSSGTYYLRAVKTLDNSSHTCGGALSGTASVNLGYECNNPTACYGANLLNVNGGAATTIARNGNGSVGSYTPVSMTFDANGNAPFTFIYSDAGQVTLWAKQTVNSAVLSGHSNSFVVQPANFVLSGIQQTASPNTANPAAANAAGAKFVKAGEAFGMTVTAVTSTGSIAYNFGNEIVPESVKLTNTLVSGLGLTNNPALSGTFGAFVGGVASGTAFSWGEVGIITLTPSISDGDYLGSGDVTGTSSGNIGRFYPDHFVITSPAATEACPAASPFSYFGQDGFSTVFTLTAQNVSNTTTVNYAGNGATGFAKLPLTAWGAAPATSGSPGFGFAVGTWSPSQPSGASLVASATAPTATNGNTWSLGKTTVTAQHKIVRPSVSAAPVTVTLTGLPVDSDGVTTSSATIIGSSLQRFGRLWLGNAFGTDQSSLSMPYEFQYWNGNAFVKNVADTCSSFSASNLSRGNYQGGVTASNMGISKFSVGANSNGGGNITISSPGTGVSGSTDIAVNLGSSGSPADCWSIGGGTSASESYLSGKWCGSNYDRNPNARATFGVFGGNLRKGPIYVRESY